MPKSFIIFNGQSSAKFGVTIEELPQSSHAERRAEPYQIAGRNGSFVREDGTFENYEQAYTFNTRNITIDRNAYQTSCDIATWLLGSSGYCRLEDTYEPECYRLARFAGPFNVESILHKYGRGTIVFDCQPERYLKYGEKAVTALESVPPLMAASFELSNPTGQIARPLIRVTGQGELQFAVDAVGYERVAVRVLLETKNTVIIDSDTYKATYPDGAEANDAVDLKNGLSYPIWPVLGPGVNTISNIQRNTGGVIEKLEIIPRWWSL